jgi:hypothetical protein
LHRRAQTHTRLWQLLLCTRSFMYRERVCERGRRGRRYLNIFHQPELLRVKVALGTRERERERARKRETWIYSINQSSWGLKSLSAHEPKSGSAKFNNIVLRPTHCESEFS